MGSLVAIAVVILHRAYRTEGDAEADPVRCVLGYPAMGQKHTLLVVDDDLDLLELIDLVLGVRYRLLIAADARSALHMLQQNHVDAILSDLVMPEMDGLALFHQARERGIGAPCLLLSAYPEAIEQADERQLFAMLQKPCSAEELFEACEQAVASKHA